MAKKINVTYFDNNNIDFDAWVKEYKEFMDECCGEEIDENDLDEDKVWNFIHNSLDNDWDDFFSNLLYSTYSDSECVILGSVGRWTGTHQIVPTYCRDLDTAIRKCCSNCDYITIKQVGGHIEVESSHHDGTNHFTIYLLSNRGVEAQERIEEGYGTANLACRCYHKAIKGYLF